MTSSRPEGAPSRRRLDLTRLCRADWAVAAGTLLYLVCLTLPWFRVHGIDLGSGFAVPGVSVNGFDSGVLVVALVLLLLASAWALLPAVAEGPAPSPRSSVTACLAALAFLLTLVEWLLTFDAGFTLFGLLTFLTAAAVLACAVLRLLPDLHLRADLPRLAGAAGLANRPARAPHARARPGPRRNRARARPRTGRAAPERPAARQRDGLVRRGAAHRARALGEWRGDLAAGPPAHPRSGGAPRPGR